ncbi:phosphonate ABC transporter ATP-binding protein [Marinomonas sp. S3726]|uniref:putative 2-aminoethylphosphonate ABC transporter ATP-binding protein n=1 Tax=Marinomonas sp. S3726 TaxID=579484 RepID=UPI0005FA078D|nr:putative 2-aminoethylphosphonate ABC transporter ATP-binding protein [Marinomonas sp. S3726]KJZ13518.1 phosphonate ABC transporter ATP-binding protein [Marinomonas sp. S3726]
MSAYLNIHKLNKSFANFKALEDISLSVEEGEFICFLGPSGCGKTTLLRCIAGLEIADQGYITQASKNITRLPASHRDFGIVFQSYALFPNLSVADNLALALKQQGHNKKEVQKKVNHWLSVIDLAGSGDKFPSQLSGGQQQRVALARALALSPGLLLLDEPLSALDAKVRHHLRTEICQLQKQLGITTIMVTHDQEEAMVMADKIVVMNHGKIEQVGTPSEIYLEPASHFVANFVGSMNFLPAQLGQDNEFRLAGQSFSPLWPEFISDYIENTESDVQQSLILGVRPEDIQFSNIEESNQNLASNISFPINIQSLTFQGASIKVDCQLLKDKEKRTSETIVQEIQVEIPLQESLNLDLKIGDHKQIFFPHNKLHYFRTEISQ